MAEELKPCPFCGAKATGAHQAGSAFFIDVDHEPTCFLTDFQRTEAEAIAAWNALHLTETDRTGNATQEAELTRLRQRVAELEAGERKTRAECAAIAISFFGLPNGDGAS